MILIVPIIAFIATVIGLIFLSNKILKNKDVSKRKRNRRWIIISSSILFPILGFLYFSFLFGIALDDHYDVTRGTFLWYATMDNKTITEFPILEPMGNATYNKIGGDGPSIATGWEVEYNSKKDTENLSSTIIEYLKSDGFELSGVNETQYYWTGRYKANGNTKLFSGFNKKGESLDLLIQRQDNRTTRIECTIVY
jgi:hypothetical protein